MEVQLVPHQRERLLRFTEIMFQAICSVFPCLPAYRSMFSVFPWFKPILMDLSNNKKFIKDNFK
jgi:hypothetical protein